MSTWEPSLPFGVPRDVPLDDEVSTTGLPWERCPDESHVWGFQFYDARLYSFLRRFGPDATRGKSQLHIRFKSPKTGAPTSEYWYFFDDHDAAAGFHQKLKNANHPGFVVQELIAAGIPYHKQAAF